MRTVVGNWSSVFFCITWDLKCDRPLQVTFKVKIPLIVTPGRINWDEPEELQLEGSNLLLCPSAPNLFPSRRPQAFDAFIYIFFALEMVVKMVALGIFGRRCYLGDTWNRLDFFIVMAGWATVPAASPWLMVLFVCWQRCFFRCVKKYYAFSSLWGFHCMFCLFFFSPFCFRIGSFQAGRRVNVNWIPTRLFCYGKCTDSSTWLRRVSGLRMEAGASLLCISYQ